MLIAAVYPFAFHAHPEVWLLVGATGLSYFYAVTRIGPKAVAAPEGVVTRSQVGWFVGGLLMLWAASDWPLHDLGYWRDG